MGGRGAASGGRMGGGGGVGPSDILDERSLISERESNAVMVDQVLTALRGVANEYNETAGDLTIATLNQKSSNVIAFSDGTNIGFNEAFFNSTLEQAYDNSIKQGFHPSRGNKSATEAVIAHEFGHNLTQTAGINMGKISGGRSLTMDEAATRIVKEARPATNSRGVVQMARKISGYATQSNAEAIAEAVSDVYCNKGRAKAESKAIVNVLKKYL